MEGLQMMIPVVFSVDKNYAMPLRAAIGSLLENKFPETEYDIYVLHSDDYASEDRICLRRIAEKNDGVKINFFPMGNAYKNAVISFHTMTKATFYRLSIHRLLPDSYTHCIYCDSDTIIHCDLSSLFRIDLQEYYLAGVVDPVIRYSGKRQMFEDFDGYINAGVLVINLKKWRETMIEDLFGKYIGCKLKYHDQDILNLVCKDRILLLENDKYVVSGVLNKRKYKEVKSVIIHYCGLIKPWDIAVLNPFFTLWVQYAERASIDVRGLALEEKRRNLDGLIERKKMQSVIVWGMSASTLDLCYFLEELGLEVLAIGDNDTEKVRQGSIYYKVIDAEDILVGREDIYYIVNAVNCYRQIKEQLIEKGVSEEKIMSWQELKQSTFGAGKG